MKGLWKYDLVCALLAIIASIAFYATENTQLNDVWVFVSGVAVTLLVVSIRGFFLDK